MPDYQIARVSFPGVLQYEECSGTDMHGISPAIFSITMYPQSEPPQLFGDLVFYFENQFGSFETRIPNCRVDAARYRRDASGKIVEIRLMDERWRWQFPTITGRYNIRLPNGFVNPDHEKTPQELAELCFEAMGVQNFDASVLPNDARPDIDWDCVNAAESLAAMCDDLGCRIVPQRSTNSWIICPAGEGLEFPDEPWQYESPGDGIDPVEFPDILTIATAPIQYQTSLPLEPVGRNLDQSIVPISELKYRRGNASPYGFDDFQFQSLISPVRQEMPDGTLLSPQEIALSYVWKMFRINEDAVDGQTGVIIHGYSDQTPPEPVLRKQIIVTNTLTQEWTDDRGEQHQRNAFIYGSFYGAHAENRNYPPGTRIDYQGAVFRESDDEPASFSINCDPIDTDRTHIMTSRPMVKIASNGAISPPDLNLMATVLIRDPETWQPIRYERDLVLASGEPDETLRLKIIKEEIQPYYVSNYDPATGDFESVDDNLDDVDKQCDYYLNSIKRTFEIIATSVRTYVGLYPIDLDGRRQQVTYRSGVNGHDTTLSLGTEHDFDIPTYLERRQRDGRRNSREKMKLIVEIIGRREKLVGNWGTSR